MSGDVVCVKTGLEAEFLCSVIGSHAQHLLSSRSIVCSDDATMYTNGRCQLSLSDSEAVTDVISDGTKTNKPRPCPLLTT